MPKTERIITDDRRHGTVPRGEYARSLASSAPVPGQIIDGKYRVERILGEGGMGVVVAARHLHLDDRVALKFLREEFTQDPAFVERFLREARAAVKIRSAHVGRIFDVSKLPDGTPYMVMEYLDGCDLAALVCAEGPLPIATAVQYLMQACEALSEAHAFGIIHRDLKPENLFLTRRADGSPCVKVLDFGISKMMSATEGHMTGTATVLGSPIYMSPEQLRSFRDIDARADVWSLGVVLFELLTGTQPFVADSLSQLCVKVLEQPAPPLRVFLPDAPEALEAALIRCFEKDPAYRFSTVAELAAALAPFGPPGAFMPFALERASVTPQRSSDAPPVGADARPDDPLASASFAPPRTSAARIAIVAVASSCVAIALAVALASTVARPRAVEVVSTPAQSAPRREVPPVEPVDPISPSAVASVEVARAAASPVAGTHSPGPHIQATTVARRPSSAPSADLPAIHPQAVTLVPSPAATLPDDRK